MQVLARRTLVAV
jgi:mRNA interferase HigB